MLAAPLQVGDKPRTAPMRILWAEDNPQDRVLIEDSLSRVADPPELRLVADGLLLLEALDVAVPDHVVLDLKMPRVGGVEALHRIRGHPAWRSLPVTIFSSGNRPEEIAQCNALGVGAVVQKPIDFDVFDAEVQRIARTVRAGSQDMSPVAVEPPSASPTDVRQGPSLFVPGQ